MLRRRQRQRQRISHNDTLSNLNFFFFTSLFCFSWTTIQIANAIPILDGRYQTSNDVTSYLNLALDIAKMNEAVDFDTKLDIYKNVSLFMFVDYRKTN